MKQTLTRLALTLPVVWLVVSLVFLLIHLVPGDPILQMLGDSATVADVSALRHQYGLDLPLGAQYIHSWAGVVHGDLGSSIRLHDSVGHLIVMRYPYTLALAATALVLSLVLALPAGIMAAVRRGRWVDQTLSVVSLFGLSVPGIALGPVLILIFSVSLGWLPVSGASGGGAHGVIDWHYLVLPSIAMGASLAVILTRMVRTAMLEELGQDYIRTARAKGLSDSAVVCRRALPNALVPIITVVGLQFGALLAGAIVTEKIFSWPGLGRLMVDSISNRDYALVQGCLLSIGLTYVLVNLLTDVVYRWVNRGCGDEGQGSLRLPTPGVADACGRVPGNGWNLVVGLLDPDGVVIVEVNDGAQRFTVIKAILDVSISRETCESCLNPGISADGFDFWQSEVLHHTESFRVGSEVGMEEAVGTGIFIGVGEGELIAEGILLEEAKGVADADIEVCSWHQTGPVEVRSRHDKEVC
jgi:peptide/nickel transport system permease protein